MNVLPTAPDPTNYPNMDNFLDDLLRFVETRLQQERTILAALNKRISELENAPHDTHHPKNILNLTHWEQLLCRERIEGYVLERNGTKIDLRNREYERAVEAGPWC